MLTLMAAFKHLVVQPPNPQPIRLSSLRRVLPSLMLITGLLSSEVVACSHPEVQPVDMNTRIADVLASLYKVPLTPHELACQLGDFAVPVGGHFQGIQQAMIGSKRFAIISGSSDSDSYLVLAAIEDSTARIMSLRRLLHRPFKHAGGFQVLGDYLAVGIENNDAKDASKVWILESSQLLRPESPRPIVEIERRGEFKRATAGAVGIARHLGRHVLLVATWDSATIDIYTSNGKSLHDPGFEFRLRETWQADAADKSGWADQHYAAYQNINLVVDKTDRAFVVAFARTGVENIADIFELRLDESVPTAKRFEKLGRRIFHCRRTDFRSGSGVAIDDSGELLILSCGHREFAIELFALHATN